MNDLQSRLNGIFSPDPVHVYADWRIVDSTYDPRNRMGGKPGREVDSQKQKLYDAEQVVRHHVKNKLVVSTYDPKKRAQMVRQTQRYVDKLLARPYIVRKYGSPRKITVRAFDGYRRAYARGASINLPVRTADPWGWKVDCILHEVAHILVDRKYGVDRPGSRHHDRYFCNVYLDLVRHVMGAEVAKVFKFSMKQNRVKYSLPREMTQEQRDAAAARLIAARAARQGIQVATL